MVDFTKGQIIDLLPAPMKEQPEIQALSYAIMIENEKAFKWIEKIQPNAKIDQLQESALDLMAAELRTQYYKETLQVNTKRDLVKKSLQWYIKAGTTSVMQEFLKTIADGGEIKEWYEYDGEPYHFRINILLNQDEMTIERAKEIRQQILKYKNERSCLEALIYVIVTELIAKIQYDARLHFVSDFYPRYNAEYLCIDGSWMLEGTYQLTGFKSDKMHDFYPAKIGIVSTIRKKMESLSAIKYVSKNVVQDIEVSSGTVLKSIMQEETDTDLGIKFKTESSQIYSTLSGLTVEKDMWYLDGMTALDGSRLLDADIFEFEL